jgi:DNA-binding CsgD family transcriptional regulator
MDFVGRELELLRLAERLGDARSGNGSFVTVTGPSGIGKSALVRAFVSSAPDDASFIIVQCVAGGAPFAPWERVTATADRLSVSPLAEFDSNESVDLADRAEFVLERLARLTAPVVVVLDDLHEADDGTRQVLSIVAKSLTNEPVLVIGLVRAPRRELGVSVPIPRPASEIAVGGLTVADIGQLIRTQMPGAYESQIERIAEALHATTGGNPFALRSELIDEAITAPAGTPGPPSVGDALTRVTGRLTASQRELLLIATLLGDADTATTLAAAGCSVEQLDAAIEAASHLRLLHPQIDDTAVPVLHTRAAEQMMADLTEERRRELHGRIAGALMGSPDAAPSTIVHHAMLAGDTFGDSHVAGMAETAGFEALRLLAFDDADRLLAYAHDRLDDDVRRLRCLLGRAEARHRQGDLAAAATISTTAAHLAARLHRADDLAEAAVRYAYPPDWRSNDTAAAPLLAAAERAEPSQAALARVLAVRSVVEMRVPTGFDGEREWSWETRPDIAQPIAERAITIARSCDDAEALLLALLAWRNTHRAPRHLQRRLLISAEALALAQRLRSLDLLVEAGLRKATDELEAGNRNGFEEAVIMASWAAERSTEPRLIWRASSMEATRAALDGDFQAMVGAQHRAEHAAARGDVPGSHVSSTIFFVLQADIGSGLELLAPLVEHGRFEFQHTLARAAGALIAAVGGKHEIAVELLDSIRLPLDEEASMLVTGTLAGRAAAALGHREQSRRFVEVLAPWSARYAIDAECLWPAGPVAEVTSALHHIVGDLSAADRDAEIGERVRHAMAYPPSLADAAATPPNAHHHRPTLDLTDREVEVLQRMIAGRSNAQIAVDLHYSLATIRRETSSIYRKLHVTNRAEAAAAAVKYGIIDERPLG